MSYHIAQNYNNYLKKIKGQLDLINDKTLNTMKEIKNRTYILPKHTDQQIEKVGKYIQYLNPERFNNMKDFSIVTRCLHGISETLIDEWLGMCKKSILWNEKTSGKWCRKYF